jgi:hypothetical protein
MSTSSYNFSFSNKEKKEEESEDPRKGLRIAKCCGNCKFFWYEHAKERRGYCKLPYTKDKISSIDKEFALSTFRKTHTTAVCDLHRFRSKKNSIERLERWMGIKFDINGNQT